MDIKIITMCTIRAVCLVLLMFSEKLMLLLFSCLAASQL